MRTVLVLTLFVALPTISGCLADAPPVPDDAVRADGPGGLVVYGWVEVRDDAVLLLGQMEHHGDEPLPIRAGCGEPWHAFLTAPDGTGVDLPSEDPCSDGAPFWDQVFPGQNEGYRYTLPLDEVAGNGTYTWHLRYALRVPEGAGANVTVPFTL